MSATVATTFAETGYRTALLVDDQKIGAALWAAINSNLPFQGPPCYTQDGLEDLYTQLALEMLGLPNDDLAAMHNWHQYMSSGGYNRPDEVRVQKPKTHSRFAGFGKILLKSYSDTLREFICDRSEANLRSKCLAMISAGSGVTLLAAGFVAIGLSLTAANIAATLMMALFIVPTQGAICAQWKKLLEVEST